MHMQYRTLRRPRETDPTDLHMARRQTESAQFRWAEPLRTIPWTRQQQCRQEDRRRRPLFCTVIQKLSSSGLMESGHHPSWMMQAKSLVSKLDYDAKMCGRDRVE